MFPTDDYTHFLGDVDCHVVNEDGIRRNINKSVATTQISVFYANAKMKSHNNINPHEDAREEESSRVSV